MAIAGTPARSKRIASSTLLDEQDPHSPMPETTKSLCALSVAIAASSTSWLGERLRTMRATVMPWRQARRSARCSSSVSELNLVFSTSPMRRSSSRSGPGDALPRRQRFSESTPKPDADTVSRSPETTVRGRDWRACLGGKCEIHAVVDRVPKLQGEPGCATEKQTAPVEVDVEGQQVAERLIQICGRHLAPPNLLPQDVCGFHQQEIRGKQSLVLRHQATGRLGTRLVEKPLHGDGGIDDDRGQRSRSSLTRSSASDV